MERLTVKGTRERGGYDIFIGDNLSGLTDFTRGRAVHAVTDAAVARLHLDTLKRAVGDGFGVTVLPAGERSKSFRSAEKIISDMLAAGLNRNALLIAFGGGVVGDAAGFAAGVYMRGVDFIQVPTTLLAAVDSSVGGKTGVNFKGLKNAAGVFKDPRAVFVNTEFLKTLPKREVVCGMGEIVKYALLSEEIFGYIAEHKHEILNLDAACTRAVITMCLKVKTALAELDPYDRNERKRLNAGHTVGHALESADGFKRSHGEYVLSGIFHECALAERLGIIDKDYKTELQNLIKSIAPPLPLPRGVKFKDALTKDKKNENGGITFILPVKRGEVREVKTDIWI